MTRNVARTTIFAIICSTLLIAGRGQSQAQDNPERMLKAEGILDDLCRDPSDDQTTDLCAVRDDLVSRLGKMGWCYGTPDQAEYQKKWQPCASIVSKPKSSQDNIVYSLSGNGLQQSRPFTIDGPSEIQWTASDFFQGFIYTEGSDDPDIFANQGSAGSGSYYVPHGGKFYVKISGMGHWNLKIVRVSNP
jgi:hypothetical protein